LQSLEESRVDFMKTVLTKYAGAFLNGVPEKTESYSRIMDAANAINPVSDSQLFIKQNRTGQALPAAIVYESYWVQLFFLDIINLTPASRIRKAKRQTKRKPKSIMKMY
jgi:hypothetical protein